MPQVFVSYSHKDHEFVRQLVTDLAGRGLEVWFDGRIDKGADWDDSVQAALDGAQVMVLVLSPDAMKSENVQDEWSYYKDQKKIILPVLFRETQVHYRLHRVQYVDFLRQPYQTALDQLTDALEARGVSRAVPVPDLVRADTLQPAPIAELPRFQMDPSATNYAYLALDSLKREQMRWMLGFLAAILISALVWGYDRWINPDEERPAITEPPAFTGITSPRNLDVVPLPVSVQGVYDPVDVGTDDLWLFLKAPDGRYYPQVERACNDPAPGKPWVQFLCRFFPQWSDLCEPPASIGLQTGRFDWTMSAALGPPMDSGAVFELVLGTLTPSVSFQIFGVFQVWCGVSATGFDYSELYGAFRFHELDRVTVTRQ